jgi:hypothetical protein
MKICLAVFLLVLLSACATWEKVGGDNAAMHIKDAYSLTAPQGWVHAPHMAGDVFLSRDGPGLNQITANLQEHGEKLPHTKRTTRADMLPQDFAELLIAEMRADNATANMEVLSNRPALIDSRPAVRLLVRWKNERGLPLERLIYGVLIPKGRLLLTYEAPGLVYFPKGLSDFEAMIKTVRLSGSAG